MRQLVANGKKRLNGRRVRLAAALFLLLLGALGWVVVHTFAGLPDPANLAAGVMMPSVRVESRNGQLLYEAIDTESGRQAVLPLEQIPLSLQQATIATEDGHFYENDGLDFLGIARALWINLRGGEVLAGGSTITQQLTRNLLLAEESEQRTVRRKLRESWLAWRISRSYEKEAILALYLNHSYYGGLAYGVEAAAQTYFGKGAADLTLAESALIAGLPQAPGAYNPFLDPEAAKARQAVVLELMLKEGFIDPEARELALRQPLTYIEAPYPVHAPHFVMMVRQQVDSLFTPAEIQRYGGLRVRTTLDLNWQARAEAIVTEQLDQLNRPTQGASHNVHNASLVAIDPQTGAIRALVGNHDYFDAADAGAVNMALSPRQPGSAIKPLIYAAALSPEVAGNNLWTAATMIPDVRTVFPTAEEHPYVPVNFSREEGGPVLLREALGSSLNIPAVATLEHIGLEKELEFAAELGIHDLGDPAAYGLSFALGGGSLSLLDLTAAYGVFASGGMRVEPFFIEEILAADGTVLFTAEPPAPRRVLDERVAWLISDILSDNQARTPAFGPNSVLRIDRTAAVKTGTTNNFHDNWTVGYTPELVVGVWVGNANNEAMIDVTGISGAGPIWHQAIRTFLAGEPDRPFIQPPGLIQVEVCTLSGLLPTDDCPYRRSEWFLAGTQPTTSDPYFQRVTIDRRTGKLAVEGTDPAYTEEVLVLDLPPVFHLWARQEGLPLLADLKGESELVPAEEGVGLAAGPWLAYPDPNAVYYLSAAVPAEAQRILVKVVDEGNYGQVTLWLDDRPLTTFTQPPYEYWWTLEPGEHTFSVTTLAPDGAEVSGLPVPFVVYPAN